MIELGKKQTLTVVKAVDFGIYLGTETEKILLPIKQVPPGTEIGAEIEVFVYKDSEDRMIATTKIPKITLGETAVLRVAQVTSIGAFLDWGLDKDLLLPFKEQTVEVEAEEECLVALYIDKSSRLCATMKVYHYLRTDGNFQKEEEVTGRVYEISGNFGIFVAVNDQYSGLIPPKQMYGQKKLRVGEMIQVRVTEIKEDGKLDLAIREKAYVQMDKDAELLMELLQQNEGRLAIGDKTDPDTIRRITGMSKNEFKRAIGRLYKERKIKIAENEISSL